MVFGNEAAMKLIPSALARIALSLLLLAGSAVKADNELIVYVFSNGAPVAGADVTVDGLSLIHI